MSQPQNWTVAQLRTELNRRNIPYQKTDKKSRLIQLYRDNGANNQEAISEANSGDNTLGNLAKTVADLQKTVLTLSGNVDRLLQGNKDNVQTEQHYNPSDSLPCVPSLGTVINLEGSSSQDISELAGENMCHTSTSDTGIRTKFGYSAESLPFIETVHPTLRKQIVEGKDVNLASLLIPYYTGLHSDPATVSKDKPDSRLNNALTISQFIQAFGIYKNIMCDTFPSRRLELDLYERDIVDMATRYNGKGFYEYHRAFSAQAAAHLQHSGKKVDWSVRNNKLFTSIFVNQSANLCYLCHSSLHLTAFCPNQNNRMKSHNSTGRISNTSLDIRGRTRVTFNGQEICNNFNSVRGCINPRCNNVHVCLTCKKEHPQHSCTNSKNSKTASSNIQK
ncbi:MAG: hypothetical protein N0E48_19395 [Candidatus Thiodiazotropha endolucinida]|nr:hypothetical protein [Candidatus Thiodiazotropha taylori]MCW4345503.1 hypothetical protein [Candidatus Thiodiazotropha endolucinida]